MEEACLHTLWKSTVPICFELRKSTGISTQMPVYKCCTCVTYIDDAASKAVEIFRSGEAHLTGEPVYFFRDLILKRDIPIGVLSDFCTKGNSGLLPLNVSIAFLQRSSYFGRNGLNKQSWFLDTLKQSTYIMYGTLKHLNSISDDLQKELRYAASLSENTRAQRILDFRGNGNVLKKIPIRLLFIDTHTGTGSKQTLAYVDIGIPISQAQCINVHDLVEDNFNMPLKGICIFPRNIQNVLETLNEMYSCLHYPDKFLYMYA